jgi:predicted ATPase
VALATLELIGAVATERPVLILADDVHWLDAASRDVLGFVARRIESEAVVVLAALRDGYDGAIGALDSALPTSGHSGRCALPSCGA